MLGTIASFPLLNGGFKPGELILMPGNISYWAGQEEQDRLIETNRTDIASANADVVGMLQAMIDGFEYGITNVEEITLPPLERSASMRTMAAESDGPNDPDVSFKGSGFINSDFTKINIGSINPSYFNMITKVAGARNDIGELQRLSYGGYTEEDSHLWVVIYGQFTKRAVPFRRLTIGSQDYFKDDASVVYIEAENITLVTWELTPPRIVLPEGIPVTVKVR